MSRYGKDIERARWTRGYDAGYGAGSYSGARGPSGRGFEIGPTWGGRSDVALRPDVMGGYGPGRYAGDRPPASRMHPNRWARPASGAAYDRGYGAGGPNRGRGAPGWIEREPRFGRGGYDRELRGEDRISYGPGYGERWETTRPESIARRNFYQW